MTAAEPRLHTLLIPAVGGQGGGVLCEWIVDAAMGAGHTAHSTSIPGVAQRTGSTSYYVELFAAAPDEAPPVASLYPVPGAIDVLLAPEFLEVGRAIEQGFPSPDRTVIVASTHRLYSIQEKTTTGRGLYPVAALEAAARSASRSLIAFDALSLARAHGTEVNAVLLGALAASGALPIAESVYRQAIEARGVAVARNLQGFDLGLGVVRGTVSAPDAAPSRPLRTPPEFAEALAHFPDAVRPLVAEALARLVDYQDTRYAALYLERLAPFLGPGRDAELAAVVARHLALWMTYEDAIRVADLKTRASRFARIRAEAGGGDGGEVMITDYLKPDLDELYGILPYRLIAPFARWAERRWPRGRPTVAQHVRTTTVLGFLRVWLLARCRFLRVRSYRAQREHERMERWLTAVGRCVEWDAALAREVARAAQLVKGYGDVRRRMAALLDDLLQTVLPAASLESLAGRGFAAATALAGRYRALVLEGPEAEDRARRLAADVVARLERGDRDGALRALSA